MQHDNLFELIKSLSKNEKGYFKKYVSLHSSVKKNSYLVLFDILEKMEVYNEQELQQNVKEYSFSHFLPRQRNYLYNLILKSIQSFHHENDIEIKLNGMFSSVKILYHKGLLNQSEKVLRIAKKIIHTCFLYNYLPTLTQWENKIALIKLDIDHLKTNKRRNAFNINQQINLNKYIELYAEIYSLVMHSGSLSAQQKRSMLKKITSSPFLQSEEKAISVQSRLYYYHIQGICSEMQTDYKKFEYCSFKRLELLQTNPAIAEVDGQQYINAINNRITILTTLKRYEEANKLCAVLLESPFKTEYLNARKHIRYYIHGFRIFMFLKTPEEIIKKTKDIELLFLKHGRFIRTDEKISLHFCIAYAYFMEKQYKQSYKWLSYIINNLDSAGAIMQPISILLNLIIHYELGNMDYLEHSARSSLHFLSQHKRLHKWEELILKFFLRAPSLNEKKLAASLKILKKELLLSIKRVKIQPFDNFDFIGWIDSKLENKSFAEVLKKKKL